MRLTSRSTARAATSSRSSSDAEKLSRSSNEQGSAPVKSRSAVFLADMRDLSAVIAGMIHFCAEFAAQFYAF